MWIRSQNKHKLANVNDVWINRDKTGFEIKYTTSFTPTHYTALLGVYKTFQRAEEVIDEIQNKIIEYECCLNKNTLASNDVIYQMPLE